MQEENMSMEAASALPPELQCIKNYINDNTELFYGGGAFQRDPVPRSSKEAWGLLINYYSQLYCYTECRPEFVGKYKTFHKQAIASELEKLTSFITEAEAIPYHVAADATNYPFLEKVEVEKRIYVRLKQGYYQSLPIEYYPSWYSKYEVKNEDHPSEIKYNFSVEVRVYGKYFVFYELLNNMLQPAEGKEAHHHEETISDHQTTAPLINVDSGRVEEIFDIMKVFFANDQHASFKELLEGRQINEKLSFLEDGKKLADAFKRLHEAGIISGLKKDLQNWVLHNFEYRFGSGSKKFTMKYLDRIISTTSEKYEYKSPIFKVTIKDKKIVPQSRVLKNFSD